MKTTIFGSIEAVFEDGTYSEMSRPFRADAMLELNGQILFSAQWGYDYDSNTNTVTKVPYEIHYN
ncbi:MAG: hypothetical protein ACXVPU_12275 [Bacteroidia bacterium]